MNRKKILIVGAGDRGNVYARHLQRHNRHTHIIGVAEPRDAKRAKFAADYGILPENIFSDWRQPLERDRIADAVIIATPDNLHVKPVEAYARQGYHILLEKPMAPTEDECRQIAHTVKGQPILFAVCHVLRYTQYSKVLRELVQSGRIGRPLSIQHLEPVGYWHMAHSFVRGNWRRRDESSFMLLAKSCHDIDWMSYVMGQQIQQVSSFGERSHFRPEEAPQGSAKRCIDCQVEASCPYSAKRIYIDKFKQDGYVWPVNVMAKEGTLECVESAVKEGPYGRCVYHCDNDVIDHQVVSMRYESGATGVFTLTGFTKPDQPRFTKIFGTLGEIYCDWNTVECFDFLTKRTEKISGLSECQKGHGDADQGLIDAFVKALCDGDRSSLLSGAEDTLRTHLSVFAAERARLNQTIEQVNIEK